MTICRICLARGENMKTLSGRHVIMLGKLLGKKFQMRSRDKDNWVCSKCARALVKYTAFRNLCFKTEMLWQKYYSSLVENGAFNEETKSNSTDYEINIVKLLKQYGKTAPQKNHSDTVLNNEEIDYGTTEKYLKEEIKLEDNACVDFISTQIVMNYDKEYDPKNDTKLSENSLQMLQGCVNSGVVNPETIKQENGDFSIDGIEYMSSDGNFTDNEMYEILKKDQSGVKKKRHKRKSIHHKTENGKHKKINYKNNEGVRIKLSLQEQMEELEMIREDESFVNAKHKCVPCALVFRRNNRLQAHLLQHLKESGNEICEICTRRFPTESALERHTKLHAYRIDCQLCSQRVPPVGFSSHIAEHNGTSAFSCDLCSKTFSRQLSLTRHKLNSHTAPENLFKCEDCPKLFSHDFELRRHRVCHSSNPKYRCEECGKVLLNKYYFDRHCQMHRDHRDSYCVECNIRFKTNTALKLHYLRHPRHVDPKMLPYKCEKCKKSYRTEKDLSVHIENAHECLKKFSCDKCSNLYVTKHGLNDHMLRTHQGYKPPQKHQCPHCEKKFSTKGLMERHIRTHTGEQPFECEVCNRKFSQSASMWTHKKLVHKILKKTLRQNTQYFADLNKKSPTNILVDTHK